MKRAIILAIALLFLCPYVAYADMDDPDSMSIDTVYANRNLLADGDILIYGKYTVSYTTTPNTSITDAFVFRLLDTDGTTQLGSYEAYAYQESGYGQGCYSFYFSADDAPTWGQDYFITIQGKPSEFDDPPTSGGYIIPSAAWSSLTEQEGNQDELAANVLTMATDLGTAWGADYDLISAESGTGTVFSEQGELYFSNAIPGLQTMAPGIFLTQIYQPDFTTRNWTDNQSANYTTRFTGTWVQTSLNAFETMFNTDWNITASIIIVLGCVFSVIASAMGRGNAYGGMVASFALVLMGTVLGWVPMAMMAVGSLLCVMYIGYWWFFVRA